MTVSRRGSVRRMRPERNRAPPTPPASTVTRMVGGPGLGLPISLDAAVEGGALDRNAAHGAHQRLDLLGRGVLARVRARLARDALLHERAAEVVAAGAQRELRETVTELHPRRLQVVDEAAQHEPAGGVDAEVAQPLRLGRDHAVSTCPYMTVAVVGTPRRCAVVMISTQLRTSTFLCERISRTSSSRISAAVPGMLPRPRSRR